jgi:N-acyl-L-homoserine lactone synthetase
MLHIYGEGSPDFGDALLRNMFEARKRVFVDLLGWDVPVLAGRYELDQFDTPAARYLVVAGRDGTHRASARLLPTTRPHLLDSVFAALCDGEVPCGPDIFEITRFCLDRSLDRHSRRAARDELVMALARFGVAQGITLYTAIAEPAWLRQILGFGWRCRMLGSEREMCGSRLTAFGIEIASDTPALLERAGIHGTLPLAWETRHAA